MNAPRKTYLTPQDRAALEVVYTYLNDAEPAHDESDDAAQDGHIRTYIDHIGVMLRTAPRNSVLVPIDVQEAIKTKIVERYGAYVIAAQAGITRQSVFNLTKHGASCRADTLDAVRAALGMEAQS